MDDLRYLWLRDKVFSYLNINELNVFEEFMNRDDSENEMKIAKFMNQTAEDEDWALIFYKELKEEEIEVQIELSKSALAFFRQLLIGLTHAFETSCSRRGIHGSARRRDSRWRQDRRRPTRIDQT